MEYRIAADSCTDINEVMRRDEHLKMVPLELYVGGKVYIDDESFDQSGFLRDVAENEDAPKSSCPAPLRFVSAMGEDESDAYVITLSSALSGSYNSAMTAVRMIKEKIPFKRVHVFDSRSACSGQSLILHKLNECLKNGMGFRSTVSTVESFIDGLNTFFVLESLDHLRKNGRISDLKFKMAKLMNIKPIMCGTHDGNIAHLSDARGMRSALRRMIEAIGSRITEDHRDTLCISHCNCPERAMWVKNEIQKRYGFGRVMINDTAGVGTLYAGDGGIVVSW